MSKSYERHWPYLSAFELRPEISLRTLSIYPPQSSESNQEIDPLVLRCDHVDNSKVSLLMATNEIKIIGQLVNSSNSALLGEITEDEKVFTVVIKPSMYENPLYDFPWGTLSKREVAAFETSQLLGWNIVPPTVLRDVDDMESSVQLFVPHDPRQHYFSISVPDRTILEKIAVFDYIVNNADRKAGHIIIEKDDSFDLFLENPKEESNFERQMVSADSRVFGIDHGLTFNVEDKLRTVVWEFSEQKISSEILDDLSRVHAKLVDRISLFLDAHEVEKTMARLESLLMNPYHRALDANNRAFPWPLI